MNTKILKMTVFALLLIACLVVGYIIGYNVSESKIKDTESQTFYATITNINANNFSVKGMDVNDVNFRGEFNFSITNKTQLVWRGTKLEVSEFKVGDNISVTFSGAILETYPAQIQDVTKVQLLK